MAYTKPTQHASGTRVREFVPDDTSSMTTDELRAHCQRLGIATDGNKAKLKARLSNLIDSDG